MLKNKKLSKKFLILFIFIGLIISIIINNNLFKISIFEDYIIKNQINSFKDDLPLRVNSFSELIDVNIEKRNIYYTYKLNSIHKKNSSSYNFKKFKSKVQNSLCEEEDTLELLKKDYILHYKYIDTNTEELINIKTNKSSCGKNIYDLEIIRKLIEEGN